MREPYSARVLSYLPNQASIPLANELDHAAEGRALAQTRGCGRGPPASDLCGVKRLEIDPVGACGRLDYCHIAVVVKHLRDFPS